MKKGYSAYQNTSIDTATQGKLILIAYDVAIKSCKQALTVFNDKSQIEQRVKYLYKAQDAVSELTSALRMDVGDIANNLYNLYQYINRRLVEANVKNDRGRVEEVLGYLQTLRGAWDEAARKCNIENAKNTHTVSAKEGIALTG
jgi:flagellar protein FliS